MHDNKRKYFYTGLFTTVAIIILVVLLMFAGFFKSLTHRKLYIESYFQNSVQGLSVGSAIKFHGVPIGQVEKIQFIDAAYPELDDKFSDNEKFSYVYILMSVDPGNIPGPNNQESFNETIKKLVKEGLKIKINPNGLTGSSYIEMGFYPDDNQIPVAIEWKPKYAYVPTSKSSLQYFSDSIKAISNMLQQVDFPKLSTQVSILMERLDTLSINMNDLVTQVKLDPSTLIFTKPPKNLYPQEQNHVRK